MRPSEQLLDFGRPVAYYPGLVKYMGSVNAVLMFCQFYYWRGKEASDRGIYKSVTEIEEETGLTYREQQVARKLLVSRGVLEEENSRIEHRIYYRVNADRLDELLSAKPEGKPKRKASDKNAVGELTKTHLTKTHLANCGNVSSESDKNAVGELTKTHFVLTEITTETTQEITAETFAAPCVAGSAADIAGELIAAADAARDSAPRVQIPADMPGPKDQDCKTFRAWANYAFAYRKRYGVWPAWNAKAGGVIGKLIDRIGDELAQKVAAYYVGINDARLVRDCHPLGLLLQGCEGYRTQYLTGRQMTGVTAQQIERKQANLNAGEDAASRILERRRNGREDNEFL